MEASLSRLSIPGMAHRLIECYAVPVAVHAAVMKHDSPGAEKMLAEMLQKRSDDVRQSSEADEERMLEFILGQPVRIGGVEYPLGVLAQNKLPILGGDMSAIDIAGMNGVRLMANGDWVFHENTIQSREWWRRSEYAGIGIKESLKRLIPTQKLFQGKLTYKVRLVTNIGPMWCVRVPVAIMNQYVGEFQLELGFEDDKKPPEQKILI